MALTWEKWLELYQKSPDVGTGTNKAWHDANLAIKYGYVYNIDIPANSYIDVTVPFNYTFANKPMLMVCCAGGNSSTLFTSRPTHVDTEKATVKMNTSATWEAAVHLYWLAIDVA